MYDDKYHATKCPRKNLRYCWDFISVKKRIFVSQYFDFFSSEMFLFLVLHEEKRMKDLNISGYATYSTLGMNFNIFYIPYKNKKHRFQCFLYLISNMYAYIKILF